MKSFSVRFDTDRREVFTEAMNRLKQAVSDCLVDKKADLVAKRVQLNHQYNDPETSMVDKLAIQKKIDNLAEQIKAVDDKLNKRDRPENHFAEQTNENLDAATVVTADKLAEMITHGTVTMPDLSESMLSAAHSVEAMSYEQQAHLADTLVTANVEMQVEDDYNMIDGIINNGSKEELLKSQKELSETLAAMKEIAGNKYMMESIREGVAEDIPNLEKQLSAVTAALEKLENQPVIDAKNFLSHMVESGKAEIQADGGFKVNAEYYSELSRNDRHIETMTEAQAMEVMTALTSAGVQFSAATNGDDRVCVTVSNGDISALNDVMRSAVGKLAHTDDKGKYQTINPEYYASLDKNQRHISAEPKDTAQEIIAELQENNIPYSAVIRKNDTVAITVSQDNAQAYQQIENAVKGDRAVELESSNQLPKKEEVSQHIDEKKTPKKQAVKKNRVFFSRRKMQRDAQRISGQKRQKTPEKNHGIE